MKLSILPVVWAVLTLTATEAIDCTERERVLVIGTHPDDEILCCSGVISRALSHGMCVNVAILTNGEYWAANKERGLERQVESLNALSRLGLKDPEDVIFLGYPDNYLKTIRQSYQDTDAALLTNKNIDSTFGGYGRGKADYHYTKHGAHGPYNYPTLLYDVTNILNDYDPNYIFVTATSIDSHGDHKVTHEVTMDALAQAKVPSLRAIYSTTVWNGNNTWPNSMDPYANIDEIDPPFGFIKTPVRINVPLEMRTTKWESNPKYLAMSEHVTQNGVQCSFLLRFLHRDEMFWAKSPFDGKGVPIADAGSDQDVCQGSLVLLDGRRSVMDTTDAKIEWTQTKGPLVKLVDANTLTPHFTAPKLQNQDGLGAELEFELSITSYNGVKAFPSSVVVSILPYNYKKYGENVARMANVKASSERRYYRQSAEAAIDGAVDGLIRVSPSEFGAKYHEWVTEREREGAWIKLMWDRPIHAAKVVLYDRISCKNQVTGGILGFSDGSTITVGMLDNKGSPNIFEFEPKTVTEIYFNITQVSYSTEETGLAEIMVYELENEPGCPIKEDKIQFNDEDDNKNIHDENDKINGVDDNNNDDEEDEDDNNNKKHNKNKNENKDDLIEKIKNNKKEKLIEEQLREEEEEEEEVEDERKNVGEINPKLNERVVEEIPPDDRRNGLDPNTNFVFGFFVIITLVVLFVVFLKKKPVPKRSANPIVRAVFYRPHTHEF